MLKANRARVVRARPFTIQLIYETTTHIQPGTLGLDSGYLKFYDARYIDTRIGKPAAGREFFSGRRTRNKNLNSENLHKYRGHKVKKGRLNIRRQRYPLQPWDTVVFNGQRHRVK
jgi:hypothetical protein